MTDDKPLWVSIGVVARPHGLRGEVRLHAPGVELAVLRTFRTVRWVVDGQPERIVEVERWRGCPPKLIIQVKGVHCLDDAEALSGGRLEIDGGKTLPGEGEAESEAIYAFELSGATVQDTSGKRLGVIEAILDNGGQALGVMQGHSGEKLLPLVSETLLHFDRKTRVLTVEIPEGLWED